MSTEYKLTQYSHGAGCGCKIAPAVLETILHSDLPAGNFPALLVGNSSKDDAAVYHLGNGQALISTTDFFMPIVDDAFDFGRIAAANAISDVYAMGGTPTLAIAILGWPVEQLPANLAKAVLEGARSICAEAKIPLAGGHSIDSKEPIFGLSVNGLVATNHLKQNNTAQEGDVLLMTKPLGVGILSTAMKRGVLATEHQDALIQQLTTLNKIGAQLGQVAGVHAMTDITGFGLLGHCMEMAEGSGLSAEIHYQQVPILESARTYLKDRIVPDATYRNWNSYNAQTGFGTGVNVMEAFSILLDPQTNGGLLIAVAPAALNEVQAIFEANGLDAYAQPVGRMTAAGEKRVMVI